MGKTKYQPILGRWESPQKKSRHYSALQVHLFDALLTPVLKGLLRSLRKREPTANKSRRTASEDNESSLDGTGLLVWPGSRTLASFLTGPSGAGIFSRLGVVGDQPGCTPLTRGGSGTATTAVLELGAGTGVCGIAASLSFDCPVILTDGRDDVLDNLRENIRLNGLASRAKVIQLQWGVGSPRTLPSEIGDQSPFKVKRATTRWPGRLGIT